MLSACLVCISVVAALPHQPWLDASLPIPTRVELLMNEMTLTERARQTYAVHNLPQFVGSFKASLGATSFGSLKLSGVTTYLAAEQVAIRNELQAFIVNASRLHIPVSWHNEVLLSAAPQATNFPLPVTLGASFNTTLVQAVHQIIAAETRATGADIGYAPEVNLYVDGRFGRLQEGFSEDPFLTSRLAVAAVQGLQGDGGSGPGTPLPPGRVAALAKHYLSYGKAAGGQNVGQSELSERTLREIYLAPWRAMIGEAGLRGLMPAHQTIFDVPVHGNAWVGQTLLRAELNWTLGLSVSDCSDIGALISWGLANNGTKAAALGLEASVDMDNMCSKNADGNWTYQHIEEAVADGLVSEQRVNESCARVLAQKFAAGLFEDHVTHSTNASLAALLDSPASRRVALEASEQGIVLLLNKGAMLPLKPSSVQSKPPPAASASPPPLHVHRRDASASATATAWEHAGGSGIALIGEASSCTYDGPPDEGARHPHHSAYVGITDNGSSPPSLYQCAAQLDMLGKTQHHVGNVSIVTVAEAISRVNAEAAAAAAANTNTNTNTDADTGSTDRASRPAQQHMHPHQAPMPLSGILLGAHIDTPTAEADKAAAVALAQKSAMALLVLGDSPRSCGEWGDRSTLALPADQPELLRRVLDTGVPTVLVLIHGRPVSFGCDPSTNSGGYASFLDYPNLKAVISAWRPGEEGGVAIVNALRGTMVTGAGGPSGRLPQAWPRTSGQIGGPASPWFQQRNGKWIANAKGPLDPLDGMYHYNPYVDAPSTPLFEFGYGLSYSIFRHTNTTATVTPSASTVTVKTKIDNIGAVDAVETVLIFVTAPLDNIVRYWKRLVGFQKVMVKAGESAFVTVEVSVDSLAVYTTAQPGAPAAGVRRVLEGEYRLSAGGSSATDLSTATFTI